MRRGIDGWIFGAFVVAVVVSGILFWFGADRRDSQRIDTAELSAAIGDMEEVERTLDDILDGTVQQVDGVNPVRGGIWQRSATSGLPPGSDIVTGAPQGPVSMAAATPVPTAAPTAVPTLTPEYGLCLATAATIRQRLLEVAIAQRYAQLQPQCDLEAPYGSDYETRVAYEKVRQECETRIERTARMDAHELVNTGEWTETLSCDAPAEFDDDRERHGKVSSLAMLLPGYWDR